MSDLTDDDAEALADIKASPDVTEAPPEPTHEPSPAAAQRPAQDAHEEALDGRAASAMARGFGAAYRRAVGEDLDADSADVFGEWLGQVLELARRFNLGFWPRFSVLTAVTALILTPPALELAGVLRGGEKQ